MKLRLVFALAILIGMAAQPALAQSANDGPAAVTPRKVITWVPPYAVSQSYTRLQAAYGTVGPKNALSHLALQFWVPSTTATNRLARSTRYTTITNAKIQQFVTWGHANGIKVLLCVYNGEYGWDWPLAKQAFTGTNRAKFIAGLVGQMQTLGLDGIDVDLEGVGTFEADKAVYVAFIRELARHVHLRGKIITVDSFHYIYNAPNQNWWASLFPLVDGINSMGYEDLGRSAPTWQSYAAQKAKAGSHSAKLQIGIPSYLNSWQGSTLGQQINWFRSPPAGRVGIAIWDAQFTVSGWSVAQPWNLLRLVRTN